MIKLNKRVKILLLQVSLTSVSYTHLDVYKRQERVQYIYK